MGLIDGAKWDFALTGKSINFLVDGQAASERIRFVNMKFHFIRLWQIKYPVISV